MAYQAQQEAQQSTCEIIELLIKNRNFESAVEAIDSELSEVTASPSQNPSAYVSELLRLRRSASDGLRRQEIFKEYGAGFVSNLVRLLEWFLVGVAVIVLVYGLTQVFRGMAPVRSGLRIAVVNSETGIVAGKDLATDLVEAIRIQENVSKEMFRGSIGPSGLLGAMVVAEDPLEGLPLADAEKVDLGPFSFEPRQLATILHSLVRRRTEYEVAISLVYADSAITIDVRLEQPKKPTPSNRKRILITRSGEDAYYRGITALAAAILFHTQKSNATTSEESFIETSCGNAYLRRSAELSADSALMSLAEESFLRAIKSDPRNIAALTGLGAIRRRSGQTASALALFWRTEEILSSFADHKMVEANHYNIAITCLQSDKDASKQILERLITSKNEDIRVMSRGALGAVLVFEAEEIRLLSKKRKLTADHLQKQVEIVHRLEDMLTEAASNETDVGRRSTALLLNALGRVKYVTNRTSNHARNYNDDEIERHFRDAIAFAQTVTMPDFFEAHMNLASHLRLKRHLDANTVLEVASSLRFALTLSPNNLRAHALLGMILARDESGILDNGNTSRYDEASNHLERAEQEFDWANNILENLYLEKLNDVGKAAAAVCRRARRSNDSDPINLYVGQLALATPVENLQRVGLLREGYLCSMRFRNAKTNGGQAKEADELIVKITNELGPIRPSR